MRIIFITREGYNLSGARVRCCGFARELARYGLETRVFSFADNLGAPYGENEFKMGIAKKLKYNILAYKELRGGLGKDDVIFMQRLNYHSLAPFLVSLFKKNKFVFDCDDWNIREDPRYYLGFYPSSKMEYLTRKIARYSTACITASRFLEHYLGRFNKNTHYLPTGVDIEDFNPDKYPCRDDPAVVFSWIGTAYHKEMGDNLKFMLDCFSFLAGKYDNISLDTAGTGKYFQEFKSCAHGSRYKERIKVRDWLNPAQIPAYLSGIDIGLLPLIQDTNFNQAKSPTKLFEYMAMAKPVVSSRIGEAKEVILDGVDGFLASTKDEFIEKMSLLIENTVSRRQMGEIARQRIAGSYSLSGLGEKLCGIIKGL
ncbi:MAG: glycosyltransferase family 4 protein [Candidatus Omnitrophota bacterium]|jgi:glycosyltransferase involved in cell wall biosynthesis